MRFLSALIGTMAVTSEVKAQESFSEGFPTITSALDQMFESLEPKPWGSSRCQYYYLGNRLGLVLMDSNKLLVPTDDLGVAAHIIYSCSWEPWETKLIQKLMHPQQTWIEIGANVGYYTVNMGNMLRDGGKLYSFEASPRLFHMLSDSVYMNGLRDTVILSDRAVWNTNDKEITFVEPDNRYVGGSRVAYEGKDAAEAAQGITVSVKTITLDTAIDNKEHGTVDFLKMDVEGAECSILHGAPSILSKSKNLSIIMEWNIAMQKAAGSDPKECLTYLAGYGLDQLYIVKGEGELIESNLDYLTKTDEHLDIFVTKSGSVA